MQALNARYVVLCLAQSIRVEPPLLTLADPSMSGAWQRLCPRIGHSRQFLLRVSVRQGYADQSALALF